MGFYDRQPDFSQFVCFVSFRYKVYCLFILFIYFMFYLVLLLFVSFAAEAIFGGPGAREFGGHCSTSKKFRPYQETADWANSPSLFNTTNETPNEIYIYIYIRASNSTKAFRKKIKTSVS